MQGSRCRARRYTRGVEEVVRLQGFGVVVVPTAPYRIGRAADGPETLLRIDTGERSETLDVTAPGARSELVALSPGDPAERWRIETAVTSCAWPLGFELASDPDGLSPFLLLGPGDAMVWLAGPLASEKTQPIEKLVAEGQTVRAVAESGGRERIDLDYEVGGERWWQRRYVIPWTDGETLVASGQARSATEELTSLALDLVERSLEPNE